ncbi:MAG: glycosyltransferase family 4 protein, partial [Salinivenus sp.]
MTSSPRMRLLVVTQDFPPDVGGIQTYSWELARRLSAKASALEVVAPARPAAAAVDRAAPFRVTRVSGRPDLLPLTGLPAVYRRARALRPDRALHAQWQTVGLSLLARRLTGWPRRIVCAAHGRELLFNPAASVPGLRTAYDALRRGLLRRVDTFVPVSHYTARLLHDRDVAPERTHVVSNGTDPDRFFPRDATALRQDLGLSDRPLLL